MLTTVATTAGNSIAQTHATTKTKQPSGAADIRIVPVSTHMVPRCGGDHEHTTMYSMARRTISLDRSARAVVNEDDLAALVLRGKDRSRVGDDRFNPEIEGQI